MLQHGRMMENGQIQVRGLWQDAGHQVGSMSIRRLR